MKKIIAFVIAALAITACQPTMAQKKFVVDNDSALDISVYAGLLNWVEFSTEEISAASKYDVRLGACANWQMNPSFSLHTSTVYGRFGGEEITTNNFFLKAKTQNQKWSFEAGRMTTAATEVRPAPGTGDGQFETWTQSRLPNSALGAKIGREFKFGTIKFGVAERDQRPEFSAHFATKIDNHQFNLVGMLGGEDYQDFSLGLVHKVGGLYQILVYKEEKCKDVTLKPDRIVGYFGAYGFGDSGYQLYLDAGYNLSTEEIPRLEFGGIKNFTGFVNGLIALGYNHKTKSVNAYLFVHL
jgi:hypothetical protein